MNSPRRRHIAAAQAAASQIPDDALGAVADAYGAHPDTVRAPIRQPKPHSCWWWAVAMHLRSTPASLALAGGASKATANAWEAICAKAPPRAVAVEDIHDDTAALNGSPEEDAPPAAVTDPSPSPPDAPKYYARWVITPAPPPGLSPADVEALTLGRTIRDALRVVDAAAVAEAIERATRAERMAQVLSLELDAMRADVARAVEAVAKMRAALISVA